MDEECEELLKKIEKINQNDMHGEQIVEWIRKLDSIFPVKFVVWAGENSENWGTIEVVANFNSFISFLADDQENILDVIVGLAGLKADKVDYEYYSTDEDGNVAWKIRLWWD